MKKLAVLFCVVAALILGAGAGTSQANIPSEPGGTYWCGGHIPWVQVYHAYLGQVVTCNYRCYYWVSWPYYGPTIAGAGNYSCRWMWV